MLRERKITIAGVYQLNSSTEPWDKIREQGAPDDKYVAVTFSTEPAVAIIKLIRSGGSRIILGEESEKNLTQLLQSNPQFPIEFTFRRGQQSFS